MIRAPYLILTSCIRLFHHVPGKKIRSENQFWLFWFHGQTHPAQYKLYGVLCRPLAKIRFFYCSTLCRCKMGHCRLSLDAARPPTSAQLVQKCWMCCCWLTSFLNMHANSDPPVQRHGIGHSLRNHRALTQLNSLRGACGSLRCGVAVSGVARPERAF